MNTVSIQSSKEKSIVQYWLEPIILCLVISLAASIRIFLPFTPVPINLQAHLLLFFSYYLGDKRALLMSSLFLAQGLFGLPVFACSSGLSALFAPTGGFLIGYLVASYLVSALGNCRPLYAIGAGNLLIYLFGFLHLQGFLGCKNALVLGILPFVGIDVLKCLVCHSVCKTTAFIHRGRP